MPALVFALVLVVIAAVAYGSWYLKKKRRDETAALAAKLGFRYDPGDPFSIDETMPHQLFSLGDGRDCENVMWGVHDGVAMTEFDYWYYTESTDSDGSRSRTYHRFSCVLSQVEANCPHLIVTPENLFSRLADHLGFRDIEFETEEFNRAWQVKSPDRKFANDFVDQRMMAWLQYAGAAFSFEVAGPIALVYTKKIDTSQIPNLLTCMRAFREKIPRVVYDLYPAAGGAASGAGLPG